MTILTVDEEIAEISYLQARPPFFLMTALSLLIHALFLGILFLASENPFLSETDTRKLSIIHINLSPAVWHKTSQDGTAHQTSAEKRATENHHAAAKKQSGASHAEENQKQAPISREITPVRDFTGTAGNDQRAPSAGNQKEITGSQPGAMLPSVSSASSHHFATGTDLSIEKPRYTRTPSPVYPRTARTRGQEGVVLLSVEVLTNGRTGRIRVKKSSGYALLDRAALDTVRVWQFEPAKRHQIPLTMIVDIPIRFSLQEDN